VYGSIHTGLPLGATLILEPKEISMSEHLDAGTKFDHTRIGGAIMSTIKLCLFVASFGFAFPTLLSH
jgi:hypothetical protein